MSRILVDMDGVLTDFVGDALKYFDVDPEKIFSEWEPGTYGGFVPAVRKASDDPNLTEEKFWNTLGRDESFWANMTPLPWVDDLLKLVKDHSEEWYIATAPTLAPESYSGKAKWLQNKFNVKFNKIVVTQHKFIGANSDTALIDDRESQVEKFTYEGGEGILFPGYQNYLHHQMNDPLPWVKDELENWSVLSSA